MLSFIELVLTDVTALGVPSQEGTIFVLCMHRFFFYLSAKRGKISAEIPPPLVLILLIG